VDDALPDSTIVELEGQGHFAYLMDPGLLASKITAFLG
jgi:pimeloyl-ACP methyl ester carboxylesterase